MSGNPMYGYSIGQWQQQGPQPPPPSNTIHYGGGVSNVTNNSIVGMPNSEALQPSMQSMQPIHSMGPRQPHQSLQQQRMPRVSGFYQPVQATTSQPQSQMPQQNSQFQQQHMPRAQDLYQPMQASTNQSQSQLSQQDSQFQHQNMPRATGLYQPMQATASQPQSQMPQQNSQFQQQHSQPSHYSQYPSSVLGSQYWNSPMSQQTPIGNITSSQNTSSAFHQHHGLHQQSPTASPLPHQSVRSHPPTSYTPDRGNIPTLSANTSIQQTASSFPNPKDHSSTDQPMISSLSRQGLSQQHPPNSMPMMQQNSTGSSINALPVSPTHGPTPSQMRTMQHPQQPASNWQQTNQYYQQQNQSRNPPSAASVNAYMPYGSTSGTDMPNSIVAPAAQSPSTRNMIGQKPGIDNNERAMRSSTTGWPMSSNIYSQQQQSAQGGGNSSYYGYDTSLYYSNPGQSSVDSSQSPNNAGTNIHQNQYWNNNSVHNQAPLSSTNRPMSSNLQHHSLIRQSPSASPLPHSIRSNHTPTSHTPDRSPSLGHIPPPSVSATSFSSPGQQSTAPNKIASGSNSLAQLEQMVMPHLAGSSAVVKSPSHRSSTTSSPISNPTTSSGGVINQQLAYSTNYNSSTPDNSSTPYFNSNTSVQSQHSYFPQYGPGSSEIPKTPTMWPEQTDQPAATSSSSIMETSQYGQSNQYEAQSIASYSDYSSTPLTSSSHEYSHIPQSETTTVPAPEVADPYAIDFQTFDDYDEQPTLKSRKGRPKKGDNSEPKKERKPRAPRASKSTTVTKSKKVKGNVVSTDKPMNQTLHSSKVISNEYNPPMMNQEHYSASQDPYISTNPNLSQSKQQNIYEHANLSNIQSNPVGNEQAGPHQEYMPYDNYSQSDPQPSDLIESQQVPPGDNSIEISKKSDDKNRDASFQKNPEIPEIPSVNNRDLLDNSQSMMSSSISARNVAKCITPLNHESNNKQTQDSSNAIPETNTVDALSSDSTISMTDNINISHSNLAESICDETGLEHIQQDNINSDYQAHDSMPKHIMETSNQQGVYISAQNHTSSYVNQRDHLHSTSSPPSVYCPTSQPSINPNQRVSSPPENSPTRIACPSKSISISGPAPTTIVTAMHVNSSSNHQGTNDSNVANSTQSSTPAPSGYHMNSPSHYQAAHEQHPTIEIDQSQNMIESSESIQYQSTTNQSSVTSSIPSCIIDQTILGGQIDDTLTMPNEPMIILIGDQSNLAKSPNTFCIKDQTSQDDPTIKNQTISEEPANAILDHSSQITSPCYNGLLDQHDQYNVTLQDQSADNPNLSQFLDKTPLEPFANVQNVEKLSKKVITSPSLPIEDATTNEQKSLKSPSVDNPSSNSQQTIIALDKEDKTSKNKSVCNSLHKRKIRSKDNNNSAGQNLQQVKTQDSSVETVACSKGAKTNSAIDDFKDSKNNGGDIKPKLKRKRANDSSSDKPIRRRKKTENGDHEFVGSSSVVSIQQNKMDSAVSPALSLSSTSTISVMKQDQSPSLCSDRPIICLNTGSVSVGSSSVSPSTKATSNGSVSSGGSGHRSSRRRSSERKESIIEGLMRTSDFVIAKKDLKERKPHLWRITGNGMLQQFLPIVNENINKDNASNQNFQDKPDILDELNKRGELEKMDKKKTIDYQSKSNETKQPDELAKLSQTSKQQSDKTDEPYRPDEPVIYCNTSNYAGWLSSNKRDYIGVDVKLTHSKSQITVERLSLNLQTPRATIEFYDSHYAVYIQILINMCLDNQFWAIPEPEEDNLEYYMSSSRVIDDVIQRNKAKLLSKVKLDPEIVRCLDRFPNMIFKEPRKDEKNSGCMGCQNASILVTIGFTKESYKRDSLKVIEESIDQNDLKIIRLCNSCDEKVRLYSELQHFRWKLYLKANSKVLSFIVDDNPQHSVLLDKCMKDREWISMMFEERDKLLEKVDRVLSFQD